MEKDFIEKTKKMKVYTKSLYPEWNNYAISFKFKESKQKHQEHIQKLKITRKFNKLDHSQLMKAQNLGYWI